MTEKRSDAIVAKLAAQALDYYEEAYRLVLQNSELDKSWQQILVVKRSFFAAEAHSRMGFTAMAGEEYGMAIARLRVSGSRLEDGRLTKVHRLLYHTPARPWTKLLVLSLVTVKPFTTPSARNSRQPRKTISLSSFSLSLMRASKSSV